MRGSPTQLMSEIFSRILALAARREILISDHGYDELAADGILVLQRDHEGQPIHVLWGIPANATSPAVVATAYRPDPNRWTEDFGRRKS